MRIQLLGHRYCCFVVYYSLYEAGHATPDPLPIVENQLHRKHYY